MPVLAQQAGWGRGWSLTDMELTGQGHRQCLQWGWGWVTPCPVIF